jgi:hypothetical protein
MHRPCHSNLLHLLDMMNGAVVKHKYAVFPGPWVHDSHEAVQETGKSQPIERPWPNADMYYPIQRQRRKHREPQKVRLPSACAYVSRTRCMHIPLATVELSYLVDLLSSC